MEKRIKLNVGGKHFETTQDTLISKSEYFRAIIERWNNSKDENEEIFINRSGKIFEHIFCLMLDPYYDFPTKYVSELEYYQMNRLNQKKYEEDEHILDEYKSLITGIIPAFDFVLFEELIVWLYERIMSKYGDLKKNVFLHYPITGGKILGNKIGIHLVTCCCSSSKDMVAYIPKKFVDLMIQFRSALSAYKLNYILRTVLNVIILKLKTHTSTYKINLQESDVSMKFENVGGYMGICKRPDGCVDKKIVASITLRLHVTRDEELTSNTIYKDIFD